MNSGSRCARGPWCVRYGPAGRRARGCGGQGVRTVLPASRPAAAWSWTAARSSAAAAGHLDPQISGVDEGDQPGELGSIAARNIRHRPHPAPGVLGARGGGADEGSAVGDQAHQLRGLLRAGAHQVQHHPELVPGHRPQDGVAV